MQNLLQNNIGFLIAATACEIALMGAAFYLTSEDESNDYYDNEPVLKKTKRKNINKNKKTTALKDESSEATNIVRLFS